MRLLDVYSSLLRSFFACRRSGLDGCWFSAMDSRSASDKCPRIFIGDRRVAFYNGTKLPSPIRSPRWFSTDAISFLRHHGTEIELRHPSLTSPACSPFPVKR